jgi:hypothetical protein
MVQIRPAVFGAHSPTAGLSREILHEPRIFPEYAQPYYAAF